MRDYHFYDYECTEPAGFRRIVIPFRRILRRLLLPMFQRQVELYRQLDADIELKATVTRGWDYVAMVRRLATLEEHVEYLMQREAMAESGHGSPMAIEAPILKLEGSGRGECKHARDLDCAC